MAQKVEADVGILIAKDHEGLNLKKVLQTINIKTKSVISGSADVYLGEFSLQHPERPDHTLRCVWTYMNDQGQDIREFARKFLQHISVKYLITIGVCGGAEEHLKKVMFFDQAWVMADIPPKLVAPTTARYGDVELWRGKSGKIFNIIKPEEAHVILTFPNLVGKVEDALKEFNEKTLPNIEKGQYNDKKFHAAAVDMEIGYIFEEFARYNYLVELSGGKPIEVLHAIKAVSDTGDEKQRGDNKASAMEYAASTALAFLGFLFGQCLLPGTPKKGDGDGGEKGNNPPPFGSSNQQIVAKGDDNRTLYDLPLITRAMIGIALAGKENWHLLGGAFVNELGHQWSLAALQAANVPGATHQTLAQYLIEQFASRLLKISDFRRGLNNLGFGSIITDFPVLQ